MDVCVIAQTTNVKSVKTAIYGACLGLDRLSICGIIGNRERQTVLKLPKKLFTHILLIL